MKKEFTTRLQAIDWIAEKADNEGHFEVMREQLNNNFIYHGIYFIDTRNRVGEVILLEDESQNK